MTSCIKKKVLIFFFFFWLYPILQSCENFLWSTWLSNLQIKRQGDIFLRHHWEALGSHTVLRSYPGIILYHELVLWLIHPHCDWGLLLNRKHGVFRRNTRSLTPAWLDAFTLKYLHPACGMTSFQNNCLPCDPIQRRSASSGMFGNLVYFLLLLFCVFK